MTPQEKGATIAALIRYSGDVDRARRYLGLSRREIKTRARDVISELPTKIADSVTRGLGIMITTGSTRSKILSVEEIARRLNALVENKWDFKAAAASVDMGPTTLYSFIRSKRVRDYAASHGINIPVLKPSIRLSPSVTSPPQWDALQSNPEQIVSVLIKALEATTTIHSQTNTGLLAMQETLTGATEKAISEIFHIVRVANADNSQRQANEQI